MPWSYRNPNVTIERDDHGAVRLVRHLQYSFEDPQANSVHELVLAYIQALQDLLHIPPEAIEHLRETIPSPPGQGASDPSPGLMLRWRLAFLVRDDAMIVLLQQTNAVERYKIGVDVEHAGLKVTVNGLGGGSPRITSVVSSLVAEQSIVVDASGASLHPMSDDQLARLLQSTFVTETTVRLEILPRFGLEAGKHQGAATTQPFLHKFMPGQQFSNTEEGVGEPLIPGRYYPAIALRVTPGGPGESLAAVDLMYRFPDFSPLRASGLVTHSVSVPTPFPRGLVFGIDPVSATGDFNFRPNASTSHLDPLREQVSLQNLHTPASGDPWKLDGEHVQVLDSDVGHASVVPGWLDIKPPINPVGPFFAHASRSNDFAAVNAYYHVDTMFSLLDELGLPFESFPMKYQLPAEVVHRAALHPGACSDGKCVNAQALVFPLDVILPEAPFLVRYQWVQLRFALADLSRNPGSPRHPVEPLGIACDVRVVWHEFCHALIAASTDFLEFPFAHSAGDALAAIMGDPASELTEGVLGERYRGVTFPWGRKPYRRHDRRAIDGWSWHSALGRLRGYREDIRDMAGYAREQVLSSSLFRLYCSIGGDAVDAAGHPDRARRQAAALYTAYLIIRAIYSLGPVRTSPCLDAGTFTLALMEADIGTLTVIPPLDRIGGTAHKVVRWAFEKQGLYLQGLPPLPDGSGSPEPTDVFVEDGRGGEYPFTSDWHAPPTSIWNRTQIDLTLEDESPVVGSDNFIYVRVMNRGRQPAANVTVSVYSAFSGQDAIWPDSVNWQKLPLAGGAVASKTQAFLGDPLIFGPFRWRPDVAWAYSFLAQVDADGDQSNLSLTTPLPCASGSTPVDLLVLCDNNLGFRTIPAF